MSVSVDTVARVRKIIDSSDQNLIADVDHGKVSVSAGLRRIQKDLDEAVRTVIDRKEKKLTLAAVARAVREDRLRGDMSDISPFEEGLKMLADLQSCLNRFAIKDVDETLAAAREAIARHVHMRRSGR